MQPSRPDWVTIRRCCGSKLRAIRCSGSPTSASAPPPRKSAARWCSPTTLCFRRVGSGRSISDAISSSIRRPRSLTATRTCSAARFSPQDPALVEELEWWSNAAGLNGSAFDASQIVRGLRTLPLRVDRQEASATRIAAWLSGRTEVQAVHYPGVKTSSGHEIAAAQQSGSGFVLSFQLGGGKAAADRFVGALDIITLASSLGGFSTLICTPATMTHRGMPPEIQREAGIAPDLLRLSVGTRRLRRSDCRSGARIRRSLIPDGIPISNNSRSHSDAPQS